MELASAQIATAEHTLKESLSISLGAGDDLVAARSATTLIYVLGYRQGRYAESEDWSILANAIVDRLGSGQNRLRSWVAQNSGEVQMRKGNVEAAIQLFRRAIDLKKEALGRAHPDIGISMVALGEALKELGNLQEALAMDDRALEMLVPNSDLSDETLADRSEILVELGRFQEAGSDLTKVLKTWGPGVSDWMLSSPLTCLGKAELGMGDAAAAVSNLEHALRIRLDPDFDPALVSRDALRSRPRAVGESAVIARERLSRRAAREAYERNNRPRQLSAVDAWLAVHAGGKHSSFSAHAQGG